MATNAAEEAMATMEEAAETAFAEATAAEATAAEAFDEAFDVQMAADAETAAAAQKTAEEAESTRAKNEAVALKVQMAAEAKTAADAKKAAEEAESTRAKNAAEAKPAAKVRQKKVVPDKAVEEESDYASEASDVASDALSQYGESELASEEFTERILNADASAHEAELWPNIAFDTAPHDDAKRPLMGFAADLSDCEDWRDDDLTAFPKRFKKNTRDWASSLQSITALKKDLNSVPMSTFADAYTTLMGPQRSYKVN